ncbi:MAG: hypothetical protein JW888_18860 [Pirellulales bacterium]|nr:hypothetical protein [Pirellulales bacterium]
MVDNTGQLQSQDKLNITKSARISAFVGLTLLIACVVIAPILEAEAVAYGLLLLAFVFGLAGHRHLVGRLVVVSVFMLVAAGAIVYHVLSNTWTWTP